MHVGFMWAVLSLGIAASSPVAAGAPKAEYAQEAELRGEGLSHLLDASVLLQYARVLGPSPVGEVRNLGSLVLRNRLAIGQGLSYAAGLDGEIGGAEGGVVYGLTGYLLGLGGRFGNGNLVALRGGVGFDGVGNSVPLAARFPGELSIDLGLGPVRGTIWFRLSWIAGALTRKHGSTLLSFVDELEAGLLIRIGRQQPYWARVSAGSGPAIGVVYREFMGARSVGVLFGLNLAGAQ